MISSCRKDAEGFDWGLTAFLIPFPAEPAAFGFQRCKSPLSSYTIFVHSLLNIVSDKSSLCFTPVWALILPTTRLGKPDDIGTISHPCNCNSSTNYIALVRHVYYF